MRMNNQNKQATVPQHLCEPVGTAFLAERKLQEELKRDVEL